MMFTDRTRWVALAGIAAIVVACGGTPTATGGPTGAAATQGAGSTPGGATAPAATQTVGGGTFTGKVCDLLTAAEIEGVMGNSGVTSAETPIQGESGYCLYKAGEDIAVATSLLLGATGSVAWTTYSTGLGADGTLVSGLGDGAVFVHSSATLFLWKGGKLVGITAGESSDSEAARMEWEKQLAAKVAARI